LQKNKKKAKQQIIFKNPIQSGSKMLLKTLLWLQSCYKKKYLKLLIHFLLCNSKAIFL